MRKWKVCWVSAGVSSFIAGWLVRDTVDEFIYIDVADQHPDSMRFINECEKALERPIRILRSREYKNVEDCVRTFGFVRNNNNHFYPCTSWLKKRVRKQWEADHENDDVTFVWGMDMNEQHRADRLIEGMPEYHHEFPLIDRQLTKAEAHGILRTLGIKRPLMYDLGYSNNNCVGCMRGGMGYWNKIRIDFPDVFIARAKMERDIGNTILHDANGPIFLDELDPERGKMAKEIMDECDIFCMMHL